MTTTTTTTTTTDLVDTIAREDAACEVTTVSTAKELDDTARRLARARRPVLLIGPPGSGKTMLARRVACARTPDPVCDPEVRAMHRVAGLMHLELEGLAVPFRAPHHTISVAAMIGREPHPRTAVPRYGELSLAHGGVLFLDELPEFSRPVLDAVFAAARRGCVRHAVPRGGEVAYAAECQVIAAANPCACGWSGMPGRACSCSAEARAGYAARVRSYAAELAQVSGVLEVVRMHTWKV